MDLSGKVVVVPVDWVGAPRLATTMAARGATVVLVAGEGAAGGRLAGEVEAGGAGRPAVFVSDGSAASVDALADFVSDLFRAS